MKKLLLALPILLFWACSQKDLVKIEGKIDNAEGKVLYFDRLNTTGVEILDSITLDEEGRFRFKEENTKPEFYLLRLSNGKLITLLAEANESILVYSKSENMGKDYIVEGSKGSKLVKELNDKLNATKDQLAGIRKDLEEKKNDPNYSTISQNLLADYVKALQSQRDFSIDFIMKNATSLSSYMALYQKLDDKTFTLNENDDIKFVKIVASSMKALYPEHDYTKAILSNLSDLEKRLTNLKMSQLIQEKGSNFPDVTLPDSKGKEVTLSSLQGKFIVLSFWASQDANSRKQNANLKKIYDKFNKKGLEIYQISVDQDEKLWTKAIQEDQLNWINVCDLKNGSAMATRLFNIQSVPSNYLLDQKGEIVGKNLFGLALEEKIAQYVK
ncbi:TlpA disulfide reductase family protein [Labilibaculum sp.]|uniref:TlpA disulfide reductase family protein n=1 Tax=Labilibaculum sp. TaxID=2060723 RepID=UPI002AA8FC10|nr:TlpA disulfide reductase family protein [Labilibaculum sp.]MBN2597656.1 AhpC/TSA family protein [Marinifilaceae bacterium]